MKQQNMPASTVQTPDTETESEKQMAPTVTTNTTCRKYHVYGWLSLLILVLILGGGIGLFYYGQQRIITLNSAAQMMQTKLIALQKEQEQEKVRLIIRLRNQEQKLQTQTEQLGALQQQLTRLDQSDNKTWLLAQADFMIKLAGRKLWSEQDIASAIVLLKSADTSLADMNDPSLLSARRLITEDISHLSTIQQIDFDGIILQLNQLANEVDNLSLAEPLTDNLPMDEDSTALSASLNDWRQNLSRNWHKFMNEFITIRRRDTNAEPLLAPHQDIYLRENIRLQLLIAAQAVPRHQNQIYKLALETVSPWIRSYFNTEDQATKTFLAQLENLSQQSINLDLPDHLNSQTVVEQLMQQRVLHLLTHSPITDQQE